MQLVGVLFGACAFSGAFSLWCWYRCGCGVLFEVLVMVQAHFCEVDGMQFGVQMQVLFWGTVWGAGDVVGAIVQDFWRHAVWGGGASAVVAV